jgi:hypothetical protein
VTQIRVNKRDFPEHKVHLITPQDPSFDANVRRHFKNKTAEDLGPFSVFIQNSGSKMILAYALTWKIVRQDGQVITKSHGYSEPELLMGNEEARTRGAKHTTAIEKDDIKCFGWDSQIPPDDEDASANQGASISKSAGKAPNAALQNDPVRLRALLAAQLTDATDITVSLDAVVFEDGTCIGSNSLFFQQLQAAINAKVDLIRELGEGVQAKKSDEALASIEAASEAPDVEFSKDFSADDYYRFYRKLYAAEITGLTHSFGKVNALPHFLRWYRANRPTLKKID